MDNWHEGGLSVGQVAERMGIARSAVRWYDDHGLLPSERTASGHRRFFPDVCCRVAMIRASQRVGLSIEEIREALSGNYCRCTGYQAIVDAVEAVALARAGSKP